MAGYPGSLRRPMQDWRDAVWRAVPEGVEPERFAARRDFLLAHVAAGRRVLDLGCGWGPLLDFVRTRGGDRKSVV